MTQARTIRTLRYPRTAPKALAQNTAHRFAATSALCHYPSGAIYSFIPKNACTTMRLSFAVDHGCVVDVPTEWAWIHPNNNTFSATLPELVRAPFTYVILRCPYARLASAFLDKMVRTTDVALNLRKRQWSAIDLEDVTFRSFVKLISGGKELRADIHWRPQIDFLVYDSYDAVYSMADLGAAFEEITARTGLPIIDARPLSRHGSDQRTPAPTTCYADTPVRELADMRRNGYSPRHQDLFDKHLYKKVGDVYADDLHLYQSSIGNAGLMAAADLP